MTPGITTQGSYNNAIQGNEVQMRMQQLKNQQVQQALELQMQMRNSMFANQHTQAETDLLNQGGPGGRIGRSTFAELRRRRSAIAATNGATSGGIVPNQDVPPPPSSPQQINGQTIPRASSNRTAAPAQSWQQNAGRASNR